MKNDAVARRGREVKACPAAATPGLSSSQCGLSTGYNVLVDGGGVWLYRDSGSPREIRFRNGELSIDQQVREVSPADAQRLRQLEHESRVLMPQAAALAREAVDISFDALSGVVEAISGSRRKARRLDALREDTLAHVDGTLGTGRWDQDVFGPQFEARIEQAAQQMASSLGASVLWAVFAPGGVERMERRTERMEAELDQRMEARGAMLEQRAQALCRQVAVIDGLQRSLEVRYQGQPLQLLEVREGVRVPAEAQAAAD